MNSINDYEKVILDIEKEISKNNIDDAWKMFNIHEIIKSFRKIQETTIFSLIPEIVADILHVPPEILKKKSRKGVIIKARQLSAWFYWNYTRLSGSDIAIKISDGTYNHATVSYCIKKIDDLLLTDKETQLNVAVITEIVKNFCVKVERNRKIRKN